MLNCFQPTTTPYRRIRTQVMAIEHKTLPMAAVQFHPESILTNPSYGLGILSNCLNVLQYAKKS